MTHHSFRGEPRTGRARLQSGQKQPSRSGPSLPCASSKGRSEGAAEANDLLLIPWRTTNRKGSTSVGPKTRFPRDGNDPPKRVIGLALASALVPRCPSWFLQGYAAFRRVNPLGLQVAVEEEAGFAGWGQGSSLRRCLCRDRSYGRYQCSGRSCRSGDWGRGRYPHGCPRRTTNTARNYRAQRQRPMKGL